MTVANLWLQAFQAKETMGLIENERDLFEHLAESAQSNYASGLAKMRQQDIIRAQLELTKLDFRLAHLSGQLDIKKAELSQWITAESPAVNADSTNEFTLSDALPDVLPANQIIEQHGQVEDATLIAYFTQHPAIRSLDYKIAADKTDIVLAKQSYQAQWSVNGGYSYRDDDQFGDNQADFFRWVWRYRCHCSHLPDQSIG